MISKYYPFLSKAMAREDFEAAYEAKREQLVNFEMYRATVKIGKEMDSSQGYHAGVD